MAPQRFRLNTEVAAAKVIDGEAIVINVETGRYYSLEDAGAACWTLLAAGASVDDVAQALSTVCPVDVETARADVAALAERLAGERLLAPSADPPESLPAIEELLSEQDAYVSPAVATFSDMEDLLAYDPPLPPTQVGVWEAPARQA